MTTPKLPRLAAPDWTECRPELRFAVTVPVTPHRKENPNWTGDARNRSYWRQKTGLAAESAVADVLNAHGEDPPIFSRTVDLDLQVIIAWGKYRRYTDPDNAVACLKGLLDGIATGIGVNDRRFHVSAVEQGLDLAGAGWTRVVIRPKAQEETRE